MSVGERIQDSVLVSLAILKTNWEVDRRGYIHTFIPFVAECLRTAATPEISVPDLRQSLLDGFGLDIPPGPLQTILRRTTKEGLARREHGILIRNDAALEQFDISRRRLHALRQHEALLVRFTSYCAAEYGQDVVRPEAEEALLSFVHRRAVPILRAIVGAQELDLEPEDPEGLDYLVHAFIAHVYEQDPEAFAYLETVVKGAMLWSVVFLPDLGRSSERFADVKVFFDTPFLLRALGWEGEAQEDAALEVLTLARSVGAELCCFGHTMREVQGVLEGCAAGLRAPHRPSITRRPVEEYCLANGRGAADLEIAADAIPESLTRLGLRILDGPAYAEALSVDEVELEETLSEEVFYPRPNARLRDVKSLTAVHRFRKARDQRQLESCRALFVTPNAGVVRGSMKFFVKEVGDQTVPICMHEAEFATILWLKNPVEAPDLPAKKIVADCYAALSPGDELWQRYLAEIERLSRSKDLDEEAHHILRFSIDARRALMDITLGDAEAFTVGTIQEILKKARENARADLLQEVARQKEGVRTEQDERAKAEAGKQKVEADFATYVGQRRSRIKDLSDRAAKIVVRGLFFVLSLLLVAPAILLAQDPLPQLIKKPGPMATIALALGVIGTAVATVLDVSFGISIRRVVDRIEKWVSERIFRTLSGVFEPRQR